MTEQPPPSRKHHVWISNTALTRMTGIAKVCMDCGLALDKGERLRRGEGYCPGPQPQGGSR